MITLRRGDWDLLLAPEVGGAIAALSVGGQDVLRRAPLGSSDVLQMACFPLVPFANRIEDGRFHFNGREVTLSPNMGDHPHPLHGHGWLDPWRVERMSAGEAVLGFTYPGGDWPWAYDATQSFALSHRGLTVTLSMTNRADEPAPAGLGFHPYFPGKAAARLTAQVAGVWLTDAQCLPTRHVDDLLMGDWAAGAVLERAVLVDHCHTGWIGRAEIDLARQGVRVRMTASPQQRWLHVYAPPWEDFFCVEPVSHRPDALNAADPEAEGARVLAPGESFSVAMTIAIEVGVGD